MARSVRRLADVVVCLPEGRRRWGGAVVGLATSSGIDVFADAFGVDEPGGHPGGFGHRGEGDRGAGGFQRFERGQGPSTLELTVLGAGRFQRCGAGLVGRGGAHPVSLAEVEAGMSGMRRAARARRIRLNSSTSARCSAPSSARRRRMVTTTRVNASISVLMLAIT